MKKRRSDEAYAGDANNNASTDASLSANSSNDNNSNNNNNNNHDSSPFKHAREQNQVEFKSYSIDDQERCFKMLQEQFHLQTSLLQDLYSQQNASFLNFLSTLSSDGNLTQNR